MASQQGALRRAFFSRVDRRLLTALLISTALHAALLPLRFMPRYEATQPRPEIEVRFNRAAPTRVVARAPEPRTETAPRVELKPPPEAKPIPPAAPAEPAPVLGLAIPQQLPIPFPGSRPLWSLEAPQTANAQAAYQAQAQQQARMAMQVQLRVARAQYEALLAARLRDTATAAPCRLALPGTGPARLRCDEADDGERVATALRDVGNAPSIDAADWLLLTLAAGQAGDAKRLVQSRVAQEPEP